MSERQDVTFTVNGDKHAIRVEPRRSLADALREDCGLTGTHLGCEHGVCGACTVLVDDQPVRSCLMFAVQAEGARVRTVEGLATGDKLHPLQQAFWDHTVPAHARSPLPQKIGLKTKMSVRCMPP
jgi:carbon-monoxide dehydrogenase small subunit